MNEQEFSLLTEEYLDGTLSPQGRAALQADVQANPEHRRIFEEQARQHIRIHAQTSRVDFTESQRIAVMVVDIAQKHRDPNAFMELLRRKTLRERLALLFQGLRAEKGTAAYQNAKAELMRRFTPVTVSMAINVALILIIFCWVPIMLPPPPKPEGVPVTLSSTSEPQPLEPIVDVPAAAIRTTQREISQILAKSNLDPDSSRADVTAPPEPANDAFQATTPVAAASFAALPASAPLSIGNIPSLGGRATPTRIGILKTIPGSDRTETAVLKSLQWLKNNQSPDGSWRGQDITAMTGLALLAYLAHGEVPGSSEFGESVTRGLKNLLARQDDRGFFSKNVYAHAIATYAMAEAFTLTRILELKTPLEKGVRIILDGQQPNGGFDYNYRKEQRFDTSVTGWQIQALKAALIAGIKLPGLDEALQRSARFLQSEAFAADGSGFVYEGKPGSTTAKGGRPSMTGVGTLCLQMLGKPTSPQVRIGLKALHKTDLDWPDSGKAGVYSGYYITQAKFQGRDKEEWFRWNKLMQTKLLARQNPDGHWEQGDYDNGSHVYTTTLCTLMLEVYYRYLPTYAKQPESVPPKDRSPEEVSVDVR
jgi:hypothetical protein